MDCHTSRDELNNLAECKTDLQVKCNAANRYSLRVTRNSLSAKFEHVQFAKYLGKYNIQSGSGLGSTYFGNIKY